MNACFSIPVVRIRAQAHVRGHPSTNAEDTYSRAYLRAYTF
jgi:hypothetical protein